MSDIAENQKWRAMAIKPIFNAIDDKCINRARLAKKCGISRSRMYLYETGKLQAPGWFIDWCIQELGLRSDVIIPEIRKSIERAPKRLAKGA